MTDQQAEALRLADALDSDLSAEWMQGITLKHISNELRRLHEENEALRARLAQPEPEPWGYISHKSWKMPVFVEADNLEVSGLPFNNPNYTPVYKAPPQREWQGLTDEELLDIADMAYANDLELLQTLQAKLKEKNHG